MSRYILTAILLGWIASMSAQTPATDASLAIASLEDALSSIDRISYLADFRLKELNSDTFDVDKFEVAAIRDTARGSDRFNWLIREHGKSSHFAHLYSAGSYYLINDEEKTLTEVNTPLDASSYLLFLRYKVLLDDLLFDFSEAYDGLTVTVSLNDAANEVLTVPLSLEEQRHIEIDKQTGIPQSAKNIYMPRQSASLEQVFETILSEVHINHPDIGAELFLDFYTRQGYTVNQPKRKASTAPDSENLSLQSRIDSLLRAPMQSFSGDTVRLSDIKSKWLLVDFWYLACPPCLEAMPVLQKAYDKYEEQGLKVIGVNVLDAQIREKISGFLDENGITYPSYFATKTLAKSIGVTAYPTFLLLDENRKLVLQHKGLTDDFQELLAKALGQPSH